MSSLVNGNETTQTINYKLPKIYILISNPTKSNNLGPFLRCCAAFAIHQVIFIGYNKCSVDGSHGSHKHVSTIAFPTWKSAIDYLKKKEVDGGCGVEQIIGILGSASKIQTFDAPSCTDNSNSNNNSDDDDDRNTVYDGRKNERFSTILNEDYNMVQVTTDMYDEKSQLLHSTVTSYPSYSSAVHTRPFFQSGNVCFSISKNSKGLPLEQAQYCNSFVHIQCAPLPYIPQIQNSASCNQKEDHRHQLLQQHKIMYGLLDSQTCFSTVLHHYTAWANYEERDFMGQKFQLNSISSNNNVSEEETRIVQLERKQQKQVIEKEMEDSLEAFGDLFGGD